MFNKTEKVLSVRAKQPIEPVITNQKIFVFPYEFKSGYVNLTERGYTTDNFYSSDVSFFQKVFTGQDTIIMIWEDSTTLQKKYGENILGYDFHIGKYYLGHPVSGQVSQAAEIQEVEGNDDFLGMKESQDITLWFEFGEEDDNSFKPSENDFYKLYKIPELGNNKWFFISHYEPVFDDTNCEIVGAQITFSTLSDKLNTTGRAIEQFVQESGIGEPYAKPSITSIIDEKTGLVNKTLSLDENAWKNPDKVGGFQVELQGSGGLSSVMLIGREINWNEEDQIWESKTWDFLIPLNFYTPVINPLNKTGVPSKNFYLFPQSELTNFLSKDELTQWKEQNTALATNESAGKFTLGIKDDWTGGGDSSPYLNKLGYHLSNSLADGNVFTDYFDLNWKPLSTLKTPKNIEINTTQCAYTNNIVSLNTDDTLGEILTKSAFAMLPQTELPYSYFSTKPYRLSNIPIIGGMISALAGDRVLASNISKSSAAKFPLLLPCDLANLIVEQGSDTNTQAQGSENIWGFLSCLGGEQVPQYFGATTYNTSLFFDFTNLMKANINGEDKVFRTATLGQTTYEDGTQINEDGSPLYLPNKFNGVYSNSYFVIDKVIVKGLFSGDIRLSAYDNVNDRNSLWATTISSTAKWLNNSYRNWTTEITTGTWPEKYVIQRDNYTWPIQPAKQPQIGVIDINSYNTVSFTSSENNTFQWIVNPSEWNEEFVNKQYEIHKKVSFTRTYTYSSVFGTNDITFNNVKENYSEILLDINSEYNYLANKDSGIRQFNLTNRKVRLNGFVEESQGVYTNKDISSITIAGPNSSIANKQTFLPNPKDSKNYIYYDAGGSAVSPITGQIAFAWDSTYNVKFDDNNKVITFYVETDYFTITGKSLISKNTKFIVNNYPPATTGIYPGRIYNVKNWLNTATFVRK